jgi:predicted PhzF superfamily epimerase YddE/YHI9
MSLTPGTAPVEEPTTEAAAFGGYLRDLQLVALPSHVVIHQGHDMGAPSRLLVDLAIGDASVRVTGAASRLPLSPYDPVHPVTPLEPGRLR